MGKYAEKTGVPVDRSIAEVRKILTRYGAEGVMYGMDRDKSVIAFKMNDKLVRFNVPMPAQDDTAFWQTPTGRRRTREAALKEYEIELRRRWRALVLSVKGKLEAVESKITSFEKEFLAHIMLPGNITVGEYLIPQINDIDKTGKLPSILPLLGGPESETTNP